MTLLPANVPVDIGRDDAASAARDELSKPVYGAHRPGLFQQVLELLARTVARVFDAVASVAPGGAVGLVVIVLLAVLVVVVVLFRVGTPRTAAAADRLVFGDETVRSAAEHRADAERAAAAGAWDEAVRQQFRAVVRALEERDVLDVRAGRTADETAGEAARALPMSAAELVWSARRFDEVTYGSEHADQASYARLRTLDEQLARTPAVVR